jgi:hypothetical protein
MPRFCRYFRRLLQQRIDMCTSSRSSFVITSDYVGPDRRGPQPRATGATMLEPPNPLKIKADGRSHPEIAARHLDATVREACAKLNVEKVRCDSAKMRVIHLSAATLYGSYEGDNLRNCIFSLKVTGSAVLQKQSQNANPKRQQGRNLRNWPVCLVRTNAACWRCLERP